MSSAAHREAYLRQTLRPSEILRASVQAVDGTVVTVISHTDSSGIEQASLFIYNETHISSIPSYSVSRVFADISDLSLRVAQVQESTSAASGSTKALDLTITSTGNPSITPHTLRTTDVEGLRLVLDECKRLRAVPEPPQLSTYSWISPYIPRDQPQTQNKREQQPQTQQPRLPARHLLPTPDLRLNLGYSPTRITPQLSLATAGLPGDDYADARRISEDWVRGRAREDSIGNGDPSGQLSIRIGTFNVNGQLPHDTLDIRAWIRGARDDDDNVPNQTRHPRRAQTLYNFDRSSIATNVSSTSSTITSPKNAKPRPMRSQTSLPPLPDVSPLSIPTPNPFDDPSSPPPSTSPQSSTQESADQADLLALAFQELDLSTEALIYAPRAVRGEAWGKAVLDVLNSDEQGPAYKLLVSKQLAGMLVLIFVRTDLQGAFNDVRVASAGVGVLGVMANKGAAAVRLTYTPPPPATSPAGSRLRPTTLTFVGAHLAAFDAMVDRRNMDYAELVRRLEFLPAADGSEIAASGGGGSAMGANGGSGVNGGYAVFESDVVFWMGDLNYRIDLPDEDVRAVLASPESWGRGKKGFEVLLRHDQLKTAARTGRAFEQFEEGEIAHMPTYRFSPGLLTDYLGYDLKRKPAWTDRILHIAGPHAVVEQQSLEGYHHVTLSDHKPVAADFTIKVDAIDSTNYSRSLRHLQHAIGDLDPSFEGEKSSAARPSLKVLDENVDFGTLKYKTTVERQVRVRNTGTIASAWRLVSVDLETPAHPEWMQVQPTCGLLLPNELATITLTANVHDPEVLARMNISPRDIGSTIILHTLFGEDHFISVSGEFEYTSFGSTLDRLVRLPSSIRKLREPMKELLEQGSNAPREVMRLVNWLGTGSRGNVDGLFVEAGDDSLVDKVLECLNTGAEFDFGDDVSNDSRELALAFGSTLLQLLQSMSEPVVPFVLHSRCAAVTSRDEAFELLDALPPASVNVLISITAFLHFVTAHEDTRRSEVIANIFSLVLLPDELVDGVYTPVSPIGKRNFLLYFIRS